MTVPTKARKVKANEARERLLDAAASVRIAHGSAIFARAIGRLTPEQDRRLLRASDELVLAERNVMAAIVEADLNRN